MPNLGKNWLVTWGLVQYDMVYFINQPKCTNRELMLACRPVGRTLESLI